MAEPGKQNARMQQCERCGGLFPGPGVEQQGEDLLLRYVRSGTEEARMAHDAIHAGGNRVGGVSGIFIGLTRGISLTAGGQRRALHRCVRGRGLVVTEGSL